ncbi:hypothetical protein GQF61_14145 [Sphingobacterium sp. DK4209]|uniref:MFS transporter n=1 Tax=Sphingobacterium zhuxiongii TaxID=2662364 RepID=A0A5Q0QEI0_9SPHI|nr:MULTISPECIES: hypothetical protein [unclassified Sphingobacterium]MVZ66998.1 hypothetical protein [Sphingobacterium sp. DK4209]QGA25942.1 hypothetical protein GFH32_06255 [Sphingobacterium sp. dk4302]
MHHPGGPFSIPAIKNYVPEPLKPWLIILFAILFQFAGGGVYLATLTEMKSGRSLLQEDILMAGYAGLIGTALTFTIMLRLKLRFLSKHILMICSSVLILCNIICLYTNNVMLLIAVCFIAGIFRMWATFECNSTIQLWITPKRDLSIFFCYVYLLVQGSILLSGSAFTYVALLSTWENVHLYVIACLLLLIIIVWVTFNSNRFMKPFPLFGIDWLGMLMWGLAMLCINFVCIYGAHYDWFDAWQIQFASLLAIVLIGLNLVRASFIRHPFIPLQTFKYRIVILTFVVYLLVDFLISPAHLLEEIYFHQILNYDHHQLIKNNVIGLIGIVLGVLFSHQYFALRKNSYKSTFMIGLLAIISYLALMYFWIDQNTNQQLLQFAILLRNFGYVIIAIVLLSSLTKVPFPHFFQSLTVQAVVSAACGSAIVGAVLHHLFDHSTTRNYQVISAGIDNLEKEKLMQSASSILESIQNQVLLRSFKELYGWILLLAIGIFIFLIFYRYPYITAKGFGIKSLGKRG